MLEGPFARRDKEPSEQAVVADKIPHAHLFGIAHIRDVRLPCGTFTARQQEDDDETKALDFLALYLPMKGLSLAFDVGSYPFGSFESAPAWRAAVDEWFLQLLRSQRGAFTFEGAVIGFDQSLTLSEVTLLRARHISTDRFEGVVLPGDRELEWYPPTRHDLFAV